MAICTNISVTFWQFTDGSEELDLIFFSGSLVIIIIDKHI